MKTKAAFAGTLLMTFALLMPAVAQTPIEPATESTWVVMHGSVDYYGTNRAFGWCGVYAKIREWAHALLAWMPWGGPQIPEIYNFYVAKLVNSTVVELDYGGADLYIEGLWNVYNVTFIYEPGEEQESYRLIIELLVDHGEGTLSVTGNWVDFAVNIRGIDLITGKVRRYYIRSLEIPIGDVISRPGEAKPVVNIWDLVHVARAYGSTPGNLFKPYYDFSIDFNFDYKIDILDLSTMAACLGEEY